MRIVTSPTPEANQAANFQKATNDQSREADLDREFSEMLDKAAKRLARYAGITYLPEPIVVPLPQPLPPPREVLAPRQENQEKDCKENKGQESEALSSEADATAKQVQTPSQEKSKDSDEIKPVKKENTESEVPSETAAKVLKPEVSNKKESAEVTSKPAPTPNVDSKAADEKVSQAATKQNVENVVAQESAPAVTTEVKAESVAPSTENVDVKIPQGEAAPKIQSEVPVKVDKPEDIVSPPEAAPPVAPVVAPIGVVAEAAQAVTTKPVANAEPVKNTDKLAVSEVEAAKAPGAEIDTSVEPIVPVAVAKVVEEPPKMAEAVPTKTPQVSLIEQVMQALLLAQGAGTNVPASSANGTSVAPSTPASSAAIQVLKPTLDISTLRDTAKGIMAASNSNSMDASLFGRTDSGRVGVGGGDKLPAKPVPLPSPTPLPQPIKMIERIEQALREAIRAKDGKSISLRLDPPQLGSVRVEVTFKDGALHARVSAENAQVNQLIRERIHELHAALRKLGLNIHDVTVAVGSEGGAEGAGEEANQTANQRRQQSKNTDVGPGLADIQEGALLEPEPANFDHWIA